ncbi:GDSL-type esterase/lipase family protein [Jatrophihabitans sp.]|uniref:GDSL-type esterase/lipase family protein n=1 Tax=Jatrophihabitans sp. TaxID=1932789 RepID=UPI002EF0980E
MVSAAALVVFLGLAPEATGQPSASPTSGGTGGHAAIRSARSALTVANAITFDEYPLDTAITDQYADRGVVFGGDTPFITTDDDNPTSPVLSGSPRFTGDITMRIVEPGTQLPSTANGIQLDVGYINNSNSVELDYYAADGSPLGSARANAEGINTVRLPARGIASVRISAVLDEPYGFAIDNVEINTNNAPLSAPGRMVALGDSFTSGEGLVPEKNLYYDCGTDMHKGTYFQNTNLGNGVVHPYCDTITKAAPPPDYYKRPIVTYENLCHRHGRAWPNQVRQSLGINAQDSIFLACSGARTYNVGYLDSGNVAQYPKSPNGVAGGHVQAVDAANFLDKSAVPVGLVTLGVGGNDEGFKELLTKCMRRTCLDDVDDPYFAQDALTKIDNIVYPRLVTTFSNVRAAFPDAAVLTYGYPSVLNPSLSCIGLHGPLYELDESERTWAEETLLPALNQAVADAAATAGVTYMPIEQVTRGHEICTSDPWINGLRLGSDNFLHIATESFHPNQKAHDAIAKYFLAHYTDGKAHLTFANPAPDPTIAPPANSVHVVVGGVDGQPIGMCGVTCLQPACASTSCQLSVNVSDLSPNTVVHVGLHSDPVDLGDLLTDDNGHAQGTFNVPSSVPDGIHTIEVAGVDADGIPQLADSEVTLARQDLPLPKLYQDFVPVRPERLLDTRAGAGQRGYTGARPVAGATVPLTVVGAGAAAVPVDAAAVVLNVTATNAGTGYVTVWPCGSARPLASNLNLVAGQTSPNLVTVPIGSGGQVCLFTSGGADLIADIAGYHP